MRRPWAVRFFAFAPVRHRCGRAAQVCPYGCGALRRFYKFHFIQKPRAESIFPRTCEIFRSGKVVRYPRRGVSRRRLLVYSTGRRLRNSKKNVADFNFELLIIYQVYCIIIVTREKRFARRGTRATRNPFAQRVCGGSDERRATFRSVCRYELCAVLCGMQVVCLKNYSEALSYGQSKSFQK